MVWKMRKYPRKALVKVESKTYRADPVHREEQLPEDAPSVRLAVYDSPSSSPRVVEVSSGNYLEFIHELTTRTYELCQSKGGRIPYVVIKELVENLMHAYFKDAIITILDDGNTIRISDHGPGIRDKEKAFLPGFSTADSGLKKYIKGVGSGLPVVKETLSFIGGNITVEDNLSQGTVITLSLSGDDQQEKPAINTPDRRRKLKSPLLTDRQKKVLLILTELELAGPSSVARELNVSLSTAHRDMESLERMNLLKRDENGKRSLTEEGLFQIDSILK